MGKTKSRDELLAQIARCARPSAPVREGLLADRDQLLALPEIGAVRDDLAAVGLDQPAEDDRGVETAGVGEHDLLGVRSRHRLPAPAQKLEEDAFCACSRFSAWSRTMLRGPSSTASVISSPRWAGRQCITSAPGARSPEASR